MGLTAKLLTASVLIVLLSLAWHWFTYVDVKEYYKGKRIVLTGASRGIGKSLAIQLAQLGAKLVLAARSVEDLKETESQCKQYTSHVAAVVADVSNKNNCKEIVDTAVQQFGGVDILVLNAAYSPTPTWFKDFDDPGQKFADVFGVNVLQSVYLVDFALPYLNQSHGIIVPVSSLSAVGPVGKVSPYSTSKHALNGFFKILNQELIMTNTPVAISIMMVPFVRTKKAVDNWKPIETDGMTSEECADIMARGIPLRRMWFYVDWSGAIIGRLYSVCPSLFDAYIRYHLSQTSHLFF